MERSRRDLEGLVNTQKEQLNRYEKRLKDVVTAYKGLLKEKEALETSLAALTRTENAVDPATFVGSADISQSKQHGSTQSLPTDAIAGQSSNDNSGDLQTQIITLMNSLATLSAEKSRMEASFQGDKKQLRAQLEKKEQTIAELHAKQKERDERAKADVEEVRAKWIVERQEREKETNNQMLMIRELQKLYADERHLKDNIEMQLNNFKTQFASNESENSQLRELQAQLKEARSQVRQMEGKGRSTTGGDDAIADNANVLKQVQLEMRQLKEQHAIAIKSEQRRVLHAEEQSRKQAALHEVRVANLESRLAELSSTVGSYDRLRQQDQHSIHALKQQLQELELNTDTANDATGYGGDSTTGYGKKKHSVSRQPDLATIIDEIVRLKKLLIGENARAAHPIDVSKIFVVGTDHMQCQQELNALQQQYEAKQHDLLQMQEKLQVQKSHISTLQEKVKVLNRNIDEQELELKLQSEKLRQAVKEERAKWRDSLTELENDNRCKVNALEQQLQKQRQRSLQLLDEKEQEIKTLQTSFEIFHHNTTLPTAISATETAANASSDAESIEGVSTTPSVKLRSKKMSVGENCHMLHYANEIARKDIEITSLRKTKYAAETSLRKAIHEKVSAQEELCDKIAELEEQVDRLERCKTREGANLEYLKNVIISYILTKDADGKRHMMNAISAVLQFTPNEIQTINASFHKK